MTPAVATALLVLTWRLTAPGAGPPDSQDAAPPLAPCVTTDPVQAQAPPDPNADPVSGWWHVSDDRRLWAPSPPPGEPTTGVGRYWVRPEGQPLHVTARRLDAEAPPVVMEEQDARFGFFFGGPPIPEGCWQVTATSGPSTVTFVVEIHMTFDTFARRPEARVVWSAEAGRLQSDDTRVVVTAIIAEDPSTRTRRLGGARIELSDSDESVVLFEPAGRLEGTRRALEAAARGDRLLNPYGLGRTHNVRSTTSSFSIVGQGHTFSFPTHTSADFASLLVGAGDALRARP